MLNREESEALVTNVLKMVDAEQAEAVLSSSSTNSTRFSGNVITQNVGLAGRQLCLRVVIGKRQGTAKVNQFDDDSIKRCVASALAVCRVGIEDQDLQPLLDKQPEYQPVDSFRQATSDSTPGSRADAIGGVLGSFDSEGIEGAGIFDAEQGAVAYGNSNGIFAYKAGTKAEFSVSAFLENGDVEGWAESSNIDIAKVNPVEAGKRAADKARLAQGAKVLDPGEYSVILEPAATAELMLFYGWLAGNGLAFAEGRTFHRGELGQKLLDEKLSITEDPYHPELGGTPFDMEGFATERVQLVDKGTVTAVCHDRRSAVLCGGKNTGHANMQPDAYGPGPGNLVVGTGEKSLEQMIAETDKGLLITKFHYTNVVDRMEVSITGMTRAGTYWIEGGKIQYGVKNMRFTQSLLKAFADIEAIGDTAHATGGALFGGNFVVPAMKLKHFRFSSPTGF